MVAIIKNNLRLLLASKLKLFLLLILPLLIFVIGKGIGGGGMTKLQVVLVNPQADPLGAVLAEEMHSMDYVVRELSEEEAKESLLENTVDGIVYIPSSFSEDILKGADVILEMQTNEGQQFMKFVQAYAERFIVRAQMLSSLHAPGEVNELVELLRQREADTSFHVKQVDVPVEKAGLLLSSGFFVYLISINMLMVTQLLQNEIAWKTLERIQRSPVQRSRVIYGNVAAGMVILLINLLMIALVSRLLYGEILPMAYYLVWFAYGVTWLMIGVFLAMSISLPSVYTSLMTLLSVLGSMLGGAFVPLYLMTPFLQRMAAITPQYWAMEATRILGQGGALHQLAPHFLAFLGFIVLFFSLGLFTQRRKSSLVRQAG